MGTDMNILFIGNMGGHHKATQPILIDRDNFEEIMAQLDIKIQLSTPVNHSEQLYIPISEMDDFHPDQIYKSHEIFERLRQLRRQLNNNATFQAAAQTIQGWLVPNTAEDQLSHENNTRPDTSNLFDTVLDSTSNQQRASHTPTSLVDQLIKEVVGPYIIQATNPNKESYVQAIDNALAEQMRLILHDEKFQEVESSWRDLLFLVKEMETGAQLKLYLIDADKSNVDKYLNKALSTQASQSWALTLGHYQFSANDADIHLLGQLAETAKSANTPMCASAHADFIGLDDFYGNDAPEEWPPILDKQIEDQWTALRASPGAQYLYLTLPRFLNRYPYGKKSSPIDSFLFEELGPTPVHQHYAWGNGATLLTYMVGQAHIKNNGQSNPNQFNRIGNLPHHYFDDDGELTMKPCAEIELTSKGGEMIVNKGLIPIFSVRNEASVQVGKIRSIALDGSLTTHWC